jgi:hypothetical protein
MQNDFLKATFLFMLWYLSIGGLREGPGLYFYFYFPTLDNRSRLLLERRTRTEQHNFVKTQI